MTTAVVSKNGLLEGFHKHHIIPKHLGGTDDPSNLVMLHPYDHAIAHFVRWKMFKTDGDAWAFNRLKAWLDNGALTVKGMRHPDHVKKIIGYHSANRKRNPHSEDTKAKISAAKKGKPSNRKGAKHTEEAIQKMRESHLGQKAWNAGLVGAQVAWNKGVQGAQTAWNKGLKGVVKWDDEAKAKHSEKIKKVWEKRKQEAVCQPL